MYISYDDSRTKELETKTNAFLDKYNIPKLPYAYAVIFEYMSKANQELNQQIDQLLTLNKCVTLEELRIIHEEGIHESSPQNIKTATTLLKLLKDLVETLDPGKEGLNELAKSLNNASDKLKDSANLSQSSINYIIDELVQVTGKTLVSQNELSDRVKATENEINVLRKSLEISRKAVETDPLTGLMNRYGFDNAIESWKQEGINNCGLLMCDADFFKNINDTYGHLIGDKVLIRISREIREQVKGKDIVCRWGGEEFAILLKDVSTQLQLKDIAEQIRTTIESIKLVHAKSKEIIPPVTLSIGGSLLKSDDDWVNLIERADKSLYQAKHNGRNCVEISQ